MPTSISITTPESGQLADLAYAINEEHAKTLTAARTTLKHARHVGELLTQAKAAVGHGRWLPWLAASVTFSAPTAQRYMRVAANWDEIANTSSVTHLTEAQQLLADQSRCRRSDGDSWRKLEPLQEEDYLKLYGVVTSINDIAARIRQSPLLPKDLRSRISRELVFVGSDIGKQVATHEARGGQG